MNTSFSTTARISWFTAMHIVNKCTKCYNHVTRSSMCYSECASTPGTRNLFWDHFFLGYLVTARIRYMLYCKIFSRQFCRASLAQRFWIRLACSDPRIESLSNLIFFIFFQTFFSTYLLLGSELVFGPGLEKQKEKEKRKRKENIFWLESEVPYNKNKKRRYFLESELAKVI
jgi:hypothetical protein